MIEADFPPKLNTKQTAFDSVTVVLKCNVLSIFLIPC